MEPSTGARVVIPPKTTMSPLGASLSCPQLVNTAIKIYNVHTMEHHTTLKRSKALMSDVGERKQTLRKSVRCELAFLLGAAGQRGNRARRGGRDCHQLGCGRLWEVSLSDLRKATLRNTQIPEVQ